jgi:serine/threonine-protein kinase
LVTSAEGPAKDPLLGHLIDARYRVVRILGEGGMGIVYEVRHDKLGRRFALKVLRADLAKDTNLCKRFIREARAAASVDHPAVVRISDFGALPSGQPYFVMELLSGQSLTRLMHEQGPLPIERWLGIARQLIDALHAAHCANVVHRDLKPDNIQITSDASGRESLKVLDFGLARVGGESRITKQGFVFGTPHYMSPEQAQGEDVDHRADIYALGVLMYEMSTGQLPFDADSYMGVLTKHIYTPPERPSKVMGNRSLGALEPLILRCLEKKPHKRFASLDLLARELSLAVSYAADGLRVAPRRPWPRWREKVGTSMARVRASNAALSLPWLPWLAALAALVAGSGWWVVSRERSHAATTTPPAVASSAVEAATPDPAVLSTARTATPELVASASGPQPDVDGLTHESTGKLHGARRRAASAEAGVASVMLDQPGQKRHPGSPRISAGATTMDASVEPPKRRVDSLPTTEIVDPWAQPPAHGP